MKHPNAGPLRRREGEGVCEVDFVDPKIVAAARSALPDDRVMQRQADPFWPGTARAVLEKLGAPATAARSPRKRVPA